MMTKLSLLPMDRLGRKRLRLTAERESPCLDDCHGRFKEWAQLMPESVRADTGDYTKK